MKLYFLTSLIIISMIVESQAQDIYKRDMKIMGCAFDITVIAEDQSQADTYIDMAVDEMTRIEKLISSWDPNSQTSEINRNAGIKPVKVDKELFDIIHRAIQISKVTDGAFDISYASMDKIWTFDGKMTEEPDPEIVRQSVSKVGYENIVLDPKSMSVYLKNQGMKIGFGAIGKGYAADKAKALLINHGVKAGIINASGDMNTWGKQPNGEYWKVAITNPMNKKESYGVLPVINGSVVTSGSYEKYILIDDKKYSHIIDPRSGYPSSGLLSVTIFAAKAELADALATSIFVMGKDVGLNRVNQIPETECILVDDNGNVHYSNNIKINTE